MCLCKATEGVENWSDLCNDILGLIMVKLSTIEDFVHFGAVCRRWRSVSVENRHLSNKSIVVPWLMIAEEEDSDRRGFYSLSTQKVYHLNLPEAHSFTRCWSYQGWLIISEMEWEIHLLNPFSRVLIRLPNLSIEEIFLHKVVLSSSPSPSVKTATPFPCEEGDGDVEKCMVMVICNTSDRLSFLRLGDEVWRAIDFPTRTSVEDAIYFNDQFYVIDKGGNLYICDIRSLEPKMILFAELEEGMIPEYNGHLLDYYLVESVGELFMVIRFSFWGDPDIWSIHHFDVYKLNFGNRKWEEVKSLDNRALFLGTNGSFAIFSPNHHPGFELNCIYFSYSNTADVRGLCYRMEMDATGVFMMETREIESLDLDFFDEYFCTPLWICPSL